MKNKQVDIKDLRRALGKFPTGVTIITLKNEEREYIGVTASSFNTVSMEPPLILWSIDKNAYSVNMFKNAKNFAVNILSKSQMDMSNLFASKGADKFKNINFKESGHGCPLFDDCAAQFECKTWNVYEGGDHYIIVGEVEDYRYSDATSSLVFSCGSYAVSMQHPSTALQKKTDPNRNGFLNDYLLYLLRIAYTKYSEQIYPELYGRFGLLPEEWRALTLLGDGDNSNMVCLANTIGQPLNEFAITCERMKDKGYVLDAVDGQLELTEKGSEICHQLFDFAKDQERELIDSMNNEQQGNMKEGLRNIIHYFS